LISAAVLRFLVEPLKLELMLANTCPSWLEKGWQRPIMEELKESSNCFLG